MNFLIQRKELILFATILTLKEFSFLKENDKILFSFDCLIQNELYGFEFLSHSSESFYSKNRSTEMPYLISLDNLNNFRVIRWIIQPTRNSSTVETVLIKSYKSNKYLCASNSHLEKFLKRRKVYLLNNFEKETCEWKLENVDSKKKQKNDELGMKSYIKNVKYDEPLYVPSFFFKKDQISKNLYLWFDKNERFKSKQFNWIIECLNINILEF